MSMLLLLEEVVVMTDGGGRRRRSMLAFLPRLMTAVAMTSAGRLAAAFVVVWGAGAVTARAGRGAEARDVTKGRSRREGVDWKRRRKAGGVEGMRRGWRCRGGVAWGEEARSLEGDGSIKAVAESMNRARRRTARTTMEEDSAGLLKLLITGGGAMMRWLAAWRGGGGALCFVVLGEGKARRAVSLL